MISPNHIFAPAAKAPDFEVILSRLQKLTVQSPSLTSPSFSRQQLSAMSYHDHSPPCSPGGFTLDAPFSMSYSYAPKAVDDDLPAIIDTFSPRAFPLDLSPTSSTSSEFDSISSYHPSLAFEAFVATRSRVVRLYNLPPSPEALLSVVFSPQTNSIRPIPVTMWVVREDYSGVRPDCVWAVFKCHEEACAALSLSGAAMSVAVALESDLKPFHKLRRFDLRTPAPTTSPQSPPSPAGLHTSNMLHVSPSHPDLNAPRSLLDAGTRADYTISSNPPNPRTSFRLGDWICSSPKCAAHNFGRNLMCIGCGSPRTANIAPSPRYQAPTSPTRLLSFPRFVSPPGLPTSFSPVSQTPPLQSYSSPPQPPPYPSPQMSRPVLPSAKPAHPLLTPSGRAFACGGKVQNISSDPLSPCIMYWPDNEPFPEQGQIRPSGLMGVQQPPILNTGNRGPISHQPGDWICLKCNYLNWRRRKVCQTCLPYAEGNGDSISTAVQAERIALLTSVLTYAPPVSPLSNNQRSQSLTPPQSHRPFVDISPPKSRGPVHRSQSHFDLSTQYTNASPIYQTSGSCYPSSPRSPGPELQLHAPAPLLPSFLQDIIQSPNLSPASTSSADLSFEEYEDSLPSSTRSTYARTRNSDDKLSLGNIWRLDGEESKSLSAFALPNHQELTGGSRKNSQEKLRPPVAT